jgi:hypothetical protein
MSEQTSARIGWTRVGIGLAQGLALYALAWSDGVRGSFQSAEHVGHVWPATIPWQYAALLFAVLAGPIVVIGGLASLKRVTLIAWTVTAAFVAAGLSAYDVARSAASPPPVEPGAQVFFAVAAFLFIAHNLVSARAHTGRWVAPYPLRFDRAWKHGVQLALSLAFVGAFWLVLELGAALFGLIGLTGFGELLRRPWFDLPATTMVFAAAVHLTDVRSGLIKGIRTVALTLLAWLMPLMGLIAVAFLAALPFTGLAPLWKVSHSTGVLLAAIADLVILLNAAYQDGEADTRAPAILRWCGRLTALTLAPLTAIAAYGLWLRLAQYGLTTERIIVAACLLVAAIYAIGYAIAALSPGGWMKRLEPTNVVAAYVILATILALFSPVADPARIAVADQVARLNAGKTAPDKFDFGFLRFKAGTYGRDALKVLAAKTSGPNAAAIAAKAKATQAMTNEWEARFAPPPVTAAQIKVFPAGRTLPQAFLDQKLVDQNGSALDCSQAQACEAYILDLGTNGGTQVVLAENRFNLMLYAQTKDGRWVPAGQIEPDDCRSPADVAADQAALRTGKARYVAPVRQDIDISGRRYTVEPQTNCPLVAIPAGAPR